MSSHSTFSEAFEALIREIEECAARGDPMPENIAGDTLRQLFIDYNMIKDSDVEMQKNALQRLADTLRKVRLHDGTDF